MFEFSISGVGLVKYQYDEQQLAVILAFLVCSLVSESATLDTTFGYSKQGASRGVGQKFSFTCERSSFQVVTKVCNAVGNHRSNRHDPEARLGY